MTEQPLRAVKAQLAKATRLADERLASALKLCSAFRSPGEPAPSVEEVATERARLSREIEATSRRAAVAAANTLAQSRTRR